MIDDIIQIYKNILKDRKYLIIIKYKLGYQKNTGQCYMDLWINLIIGQKYVILSYIYSDIITANINNLLINLEFYYLICIRRVILYIRLLMFIYM